MKHSARAIIIDGGIAGPAMSLFLRHAGIESQIFEAYPGPATIGGGFQIAPNGMRVLTALGLADRVRAAGILSSDFVFRNHAGKIIGRVDVSESGQGVTIRRSDFQQILMEELTRQGLAVRYSKRLCAIEQSASQVTAYFDDGHAETGDLLLGADGVHSRARGLIFPDQAAPRYTGFLGIGGMAEAGTVTPPDPDDSCRLNFTVGPQFQVGYAMLSGFPAQWGWWTHLPQKKELSRRELQATSDSELRGRALSAFGGWHSPIEALISNSGQIMRTAIYDVPSLPAWHSGRVMLLGDAAHAMSPAGGQGASLALEDAMLVGSLLAGSERPVDQTFASAESLLRQRAERVVKQAAENDRRQAQELGAFGQWMRNRTFPLIAPLIARELKRQYTTMQHLLAPAA